MRRYLKRGAAISFIVSWLLLFGYLIQDIGSELVAFIDTIDVARRLTAPDGHITALLERDLHFDLNFRLYLVDVARAPAPTDVKQALWSSQDYPPTTHRNWNEELRWSTDSSVIAVSIGETYVFAYDLRTKQRLEDHTQIGQLLMERDTLK
jgi:hypothetical protein